MSYIFANLTRRLQWIQQWIEKHGINIAILSQKHLDDTARAVWRRVMLFFSTLEPCLPLGSIVWNSLCLENFRAVMWIRKWIENGWNLNSRWTIPLSQRVFCTLDPYEKLLKGFSAEGKPREKVKPGLRHHCKTKKLLRWSCERYSTGPRLRSYVSEQSVCLYNLWILYIFVFNSLCRYVNTCRGCGNCHC